MSHFVVMVVTPNGTDAELEKAMLPFHEFGCTGLDNEYVQNIDQLPEARELYRTETTRTFAEFVEYYYGRAAIEGDAAPDLKDKHKYGWCRVVNGEVTELINRDNPNHKWDWYTEGGRWSDYFIPKNKNATTTKGRKRDIDFAAKRAKGEAEAAAEWDIVDKAVSAHMTGYKSWDATREAHGENYDAARKEYSEQPAVKAFHASKERWLESLDDYLMPRAEYVKRKGLKCITPFAFLRDGKWAEKGHMGWWACVSDEKENWGTQFADLLGAVPDDHFLTIVDCHT